MTALAHTHDPDTSHEAAARLDPARKGALKAAIILILTEKPRTAYETAEEYFRLALTMHWPLVKFDSIAKRISELHNDGAVRRTDGTRDTPFDRAAVVWEVAS